MNDYQKYIHVSKYARFRDKLKRRETWVETVTRYVDFFEEAGLIDDTEAEVFFHNIHDMEVMPSMRAMMTAGRALKRDNLAGYNCAGIAIDHPRAFDEIFYILMNG